MTDPTKPQVDKEPDPSGSGAGVQRPDQGGTNQPGQKREGPASGGEGAAGAGGSDGFGTGS
ncbi:MAG: hypothetical protein EON90_00430 [Brevundimonas sp.]|nr:MAG: hypothetical protein EON90_00430 [Brevundimonas sp.]